MKDAYERRALLVHLGVALQMLSRIVEYEKSDETIGELLAREPLLADVPLLEYLFDRMSVRELGSNVLHAFCLWPRLLLDDELDRNALADPVRTHLFAGNPRGWNAYLQAMQREVQWFGEGLPLANGHAWSDGAEIHPV
ncbi:hypothetical protein WKR88_11345 [Trinickia caryophylli]|uniref:Uncharacterized protein n=1 Tax=Trinickia caryophylli TaxID=28094 RepID=A0A1X7CU58_TRICW|nr:hypothetical protein [Trinickia caryophylli]PMS13385.1 hypothetical protein C0Z17_03470 [Trinickia caryophylli]TRX13756.1 hypothetical protein FNF07_20485 [Trinickia caryophylli]WQE15349.1 hypothetical protein U0034_22715 [Trinickia caryophylli]SMF03246.1 hypothetical protein SAMN06295900_10215 [Trinickia caryophylli]GLU30891.1 hypothetical protein Busp01_07330 [Trinickia caryophylli]